MGGAGDTEYICGGDILSIALQFIWLAVWPPWLSFLFICSSVRSSVHLSIKARSLLHFICTEFFNMPIFAPFFFLFSLSARYGFYSDSGHV